ncbi:hypothetical protein [Komagataeibacter xylinus]|uniref:hypothetical protein n=1 Tax=Komagataeibacter xylinus TaxID=28448 RepID=UPI0011B43268|nr:hypothetical protein [Komagataeibacter xylinus]GBQ80631.1 hypothetical protein AA15237_3032 [Komagataeibacter xylinus NBRC 15237]
MPQANALPTTDRRTFLGRIAGVSALTTIGVTHASLARGQAEDAELISLCRKFDALEDEFLSYFSGGVNHIEDDEERDLYIEPLHWRQATLLDRICELKATTVTGLVTRLRVLARLNKDASGISGPVYWDERMLHAVLRDATEITI